MAVLPGQDEAVCQRQALEPLPPGYAPALGKVAELERAILAIERDADCFPPSVLAGRVQRLLDRSGWNGWTTWLRLDVSPGPCGSVSGLGGHVRRRVAAAAAGWSVAIEHRIDGGADLFDARGARLEAGCAVVSNVIPAGDGRRELAVTVVRKR